MSQKMSGLYFLLSAFFCCTASSIKAIEIAGVKFSNYELAVGAGQSEVLVCDFNNDKNQDLIVANYDDDNIIVFQGDGLGRLKQVGRFSAGKNPSSISAADIDHDGQLDLAIANHETSNVTLLFGNGKGKFQPDVKLSLDSDLKPHPHLAQLIDLNKDKQTDLIVDSRDSKGLLIFPGKGDGSFVMTSKLINAGGNPYRGFAIGDINNDGFLDIVTPNENDVAIAINTGGDDFSFGLKKLNHSAGPFAVELVDVNGDQQLDLIIVTADDSVTIIPGDGTGSFIEANEVSTKAPLGAKQIVTGDINGDKFNDLLISNWSGELLVVLGQTALFKSKSLNAVTFKAPSITNPWGLAMTDLNQDGNSDFIITDGNNKKAEAFISQKN